MPPLGHRLCGFLAGETATRLPSKQLRTNFARDALRPKLCFVPPHHISTLGALGFLDAKGICRVR